MSFLPQSILGDVTDRVGKLIARNRHISTDEQELQDLFIELAKVDESNQVEASIVKALLTALTGDIDAAVQILDDVNSSHATAPMKLGILANAGRCSEAKDVFVKFLNPKSGAFTANFCHGIAIGAIHQVTEFARTADKVMKITNLEAIPMDLLESASNMLKEYDIKDEAIAPIIAQAGAVFADNKIFYMESSPKLEVIDVPGVLRSTLLTYKLPSSPEEAAAIYVQFVDRLIAHDINMPLGLQINFSSGSVQ